MDALLEPAHLVALTWLVAGLVLSAIETLAPGAFFIWFGAAADFFLDEAIVRGYGRIRVGDSSWRVAGPDCPAGARVKVVAVEEGSLIRVERVD
jgi:membrane protein implicated in regulation of membrane protease activity